MMQSPLSIFLIVALICSAVYADPIQDEDKLLLHGITGPDEGHLNKRELIAEQHPLPPGVAGQGILPPGIPGIIKEDKVAGKVHPPQGLAEDRQKRESVLQQEEDKVAENRPPSGLAEDRQKRESVLQQEEDKVAGNRPPMGLAEDGQKREPVLQQGAAGPLGQ